MAFNIIKHRGRPKQAQLAPNVIIKRQEQLFIAEYGAFVKCTPYDDHFVYENPNANESSYKCTCGSPAVIVPPGPDGMFACLNHATYGFHTTSQVNKKDFKRGQPIIRKGRKWG